MNLRFARPYAQALVNTSASDEELIATRDELRRFSRALEEVPALGVMAGNPGIPMEKKKEVTAEVAKTLGLGEHSRRFIDLLLGNYRLVHLAGILEVVDELIDRRLGVVRARVTSASALDADQERRLAEGLRQKLGQSVDLRVTVDQELLGGFVALVGSERYDASVRGQLERLGAALAEGDEA